VLEDTDLNEDDLAEVGRLARLVKKADTRDNLERITPEIRSERPDLEARYKKALARLREAEPVG